MVHSRLRPLAWLATLGSIGASTVLIAACSGKVHNGTVSSTSQPVSIGDVSGTASLCPGGSAHPNVCCDAGPSQAASCVVYPNAPFTQCAGGMTTYPDPRACCPLDGNGQCASPPPQSFPSDAGAGPGGSCVYPCPVGWYSPPDSSGSSSSGGGSGGVTCCQASSDGSGFCMGSGGSTGGGCTCACPACDADGSCPPCPPCNCPPPPPPPTPSCDACPPGWQTPQGEPLLCCTEGPDGTIACFSQGVPPPPPGGPSDAGVAPASCFGGGGGGEDGATFTQCGCTETVGGTEYDVNCTSSDDAGATCTCSIGSGSGGNTGTTFTTLSADCSDVTALFSACGFPSSGVNGGGTGTSGGGSAGSSSSSSGG